MTRHGEAAYECSKAVMLNGVKHPGILPEAVLLPREEYNVLPLATLRLWMTTFRLLYT